MNLNSIIADKSEELAVLHNTRREIEELKAEKVKLTKELESLRKFDKDLGGVFVIHLGKESFRDPNIVVCRVAIRMNHFMFKLKGGVSDIRTTARHTMLQLAEQIEPMLSRYLETGQLP